MIQITNSAELDALILSKTAECKLNTEQLQQSVSKLLDGLKPINFFKSSVKDVLDEGDLMNKIGSGLLGLGAGYISKRIVVGDSENKVRQLLGALLQTEVSTVVMSEASIIKIVLPKLQHWVGKIFSKKNQIQ
jgi:hypothetical protein